MSMGDNLKPSISDSIKVYPIIYYINTITVSKMILKRIRYMIIGFP